MLNRGVWVVVWALCLASCVLMAAGHVCGDGVLYTYNEVVALPTWPGCDVLNGSVFEVGKCGHAG